MISRIARRLLHFAIVAATVCGALTTTAAAQGQRVPLAIVTDSLPEISIRTDYRVQLQAVGGAPPYRWSVASGTLPEGIALDPNTGLLAGAATTAGEAHVTIQVADSAVPAQSINKEFTFVVVAALVFEWTRPPQVQANRIDGAVRVTNGSKDAFDLTVIVVGINDSGRATALGYQRFWLGAKATSPEITFGSTLPRGAYVVHADAIAEVAEKRLILKEQLQTPGPLRIVVGP